jgi:hypothetical protein
MNRYLATLPLLTGLLLAPACIQQETTHTLYMSPDGVLVWTSLECDIRSDARTPFDRAREEGEFLDRLATGMHPIPVAFKHLGADPVQIRFLRQKRPYVVMTEARFASIDRTLQRLLDEIQLVGTAVITEDGSERTLTVTIERPSEQFELAEDNPVLPLVDPAVPYRCVLTEGRFVSAIGFRVSGDGVIAVLDEKIFEELDEPGDVVRLSLTWTAAPPPGV